MTENKCEVGSGGVGWGGGEMKEGLGGWDDWVTAKVHETKTIQCRLS